MTELVCFLIHLFISMLVMQQLDKIVRITHTQKIITKIRNVGCTLQIVNLRATVYRKKKDGPIDTSQNCDTQVDSIPTCGHHEHYLCPEVTVVDVEYTATCTKHARGCVHLHFNVVGIWKIASIMDNQLETDVCFKRSVIDAIYCTEVLGD